MPDRSSCRNCRRLRGFLGRVAHALEDELQSEDFRKLFTAAAAPEISSLQRLCTSIALILTEPEQEPRDAAKTTTTGPSHKNPPPLPRWTNNAPRLVDLANQASKACVAVPAPPASDSEPASPAAAPAEARSFPVLEALAEAPASACHPFLNQHSLDRACEYGTFRESSFATKKAREIVSPYVRAQPDELPRGFFPTLPFREPYLAQLAKDFDLDSPAGRDKAEEKKRRSSITTIKVPEPQILGLPHRDQLTILWGRLCTVRNLIQTLSNLLRYSEQRTPPGPAGRTPTHLLLAQRVLLSYVVWLVERGGLLQLERHAFEAPAGEFWDVLHNDGSTPTRPRRPRIGFGEGGSAAGAARSLEVPTAGGGAAGKRRAAASPSPAPSAGEPGSSSPPPVRSTRSKGRAGRAAAIGPGWGDSDTAAPDPPTSGDEGGRGRTRSASRRGAVSTEQPACRTRSRSATAEPVCEEETESETERASTGRVATRATLAAAAEPSA